MWLLGLAILFVPEKLPMHTQYQQLANSSTVKDGTKSMSNCKNTLWLLQELNNYCNAISLDQYQMEFKTDGFLL